ncbi:hypothetical protein GXM_09711 [Nostoc sphaeroides CCNUC1]|uniref:Uncharacterized protein n=1 Tax=Nostoc sphaeroides CCNUC1 TaxID=2653204 RepID=A0A5P8WH83_9NOSO|nr:hypothetical protein GXM_08640 [Nostoc sphaeroides CCNUC1]QFS52217.1 hypothetical protein GXM_09711 [Nostoc sphaeroides CCNUC1]
MGLPICAEWHEEKLKALPGVGVGSVGSVGGKISSQSSHTSHTQKPYK